MSVQGNSSITCAHCGQRIGVYEPLRVEQPDGNVGASSYLNLSPDELEIGPRLWHTWCFADVHPELGG